MDWWEKNYDAMYKKQGELLEGVCNPDKPENFVEALDNLIPADEKKLGEVLASGDNEALGKFLFAVVEDYWLCKSETMAQDILEEQAEEECYWHRGDSTTFFNWRPV